MRNPTPPPNREQPTSPPKTPLILVLCWIGTTFCAIIGGIMFFGLCSAAESAVQETSAALLSIAFVLIPYILTKCVEALCNPKMHE